MKDQEKRPKENLFGFAKSLGNAAKTTAESLGETTKNAAVSLAATMKENSEQISKKLEQKKYENDLKKYAPINEEELKSEAFIIPDMIRVVGEDVRRNVKACEGAIGFWAEGKGFRLFNIYREHLELLGNLKWYPHVDETVYYVDPCHKKFYIRLDEYFAYLKKVRVDELTAIAQDLGAKSVEIVLKSQKASSSNESGSGKMALGKWGASANFSKAEKESTGVEVAAKINFAGNAAPVKPKLVYFKDEGDILALVKMRLSPDSNQILSKKYSFRYGNSSGIKTSDAEKIDLALSGVGLDLSRSVSSEANSESNTLLEYNIEF